MPSRSRPSIVFLWSPLTMHISAMEPRKELRSVPMICVFDLGCFGGKSTACLLRSTSRSFLQSDVSAAATGRLKGL